jgi:chromosome segregation ATPase
MSDSTLTKAQATGLGAAVGAVVGALLGDESGALIGAAAGAGAGFLVGNEIAKRKQRFASEEEFLNAEIQSAAEYNRTAAQYNADLREQITALDQSTADLRSRYQSGRADRDVLQMRRDEIAAQIKTTETLVADLQKEREIKLAIIAEQKAKRAADDDYIVSLQKEISQLEANIQNLQASSAELARIDERLDVEHTSYEPS